MKRLTTPALTVGTLVLGGVGALLSCSCSALAATATFEDLGLAAPEAAEDGFGLTPYATGTAFGEVENWNRFSSGGIAFENRTIPAFGSWSMWAYSNRTDTLTPGFGNDLSGWAGGGADPATGAAVAGGTYGISFGENSWIDMPAAASRPVSIMVANTTYAALAMRDGNGFSKQFGGAGGGDPDFFLLTILGQNAAGSVTGSVDFYLADYRFDDGDGDDFIRDDWSIVDLTPLGNAVTKLRFELSSSDNGTFGMNTPAYFTMDNFVAVPEPSAMLLFTTGLCGLFGLRRFRRVSGKRQASAALVTAAAAAVVCFSGGSPAGAQGISANDERIVDWATSVSSTIRGPVNAADHSLGYATFGDPLSALGPADVWAPLSQENAPVVSLGDGGQITLSFDPPIADGEGPDFAVFENGFSADFLELAFVEVSSDGASFKRFPATASRQAIEQIGAFDSVKPSGLVNLAGIYPAGTGVPFDISDLNLKEVTHVRIVDVVGSIDPGYGSPDSEGNLINDPFPTAYATGGFDLDAIAVLNQKLLTFGSDEDKYLTFEIWITRHFDARQRELPDVSGFLADPDSDGMTNFEEYAFWTDPNQVTVPFTLAIEHLRDEDVVEVRLPPLPSLRPDVDYSIESAGGLIYWQSHRGADAVAADLEMSEEEFFRLAVTPFGDDAE